MFQSAIAAYPANAKMHHNLAYLWYEQGAASRAAEVEHHFARALQLHPQYSTCHINYGAFLAEGGREAEACDLWKGAVRSSSEWDSHVMGDLRTLVGNLEICSRRLGRPGDVEWLRRTYLEMLGADN